MQVSYNIALILHLGKSVLTLGMLLAVHSTVVLLLDVVLVDKAAVVIVAGMILALVVIQGLQINVQIIEISIVAVWNLTHFFKSTILNLNNIQMLLYRLFQTNR